MSKDKKQDEYEQKMKEEARRRELGGCLCHGVTFCPDLEFVEYDNDVPVFRKKQNG